MTEEPNTTAPGGDVAVRPGPGRSGAPATAGGSRSCPIRSCSPGPCRNKGLGAISRSRPRGSATTIPNGLKIPCMHRTNNPARCVFPLVTAEKRLCGSGLVPADYHRARGVAGRRIVLGSERPLESRVWLGGVEVGSCASLATPHVYDLTPGAGRSYTYRGSTTA